MRLNAGPSPSSGQAGEKRAATVRERYGFSTNRAKTAPHGPGSIVVRVFQRAASAHRALRLSTTGGWAGC